jgi:hypothetical protein
MLPAEAPAAAEIALHVAKANKFSPFSHWAENSIEPCFPNHATTQLWTVFALLVPRHGSLTGDDLAVRFDEYDFASRSEPWPPHRSRKQSP